VADREALRCRGKKEKPDMELPPGEKQKVLESLAGGKSG
jgi:hypothetical protein